MNRARGLVALAFVAGLAGCGTGPRPEAMGGPGAGPRSVTPARALLYENTLTVEMSDRSFCTGARGRQGRTWQGHMQGCPHLWPYRVSLPPGRVTRLPLQAIESGPALVEMTAPDGRVYRYGSAR